MGNHCIVWSPVAASSEGMRMVLETSGKTTVCDIVGGPASR